jgi:thiol-disulfide isomerase/thioredoxin
MRIIQNRPFEELFISLFLFTVISFNAESQELAEKGKLPAGKISEYTLYIFTGSDWCVNCKRLEKKVLSDPAFAGIMEKNGIEIRIIDFPQRKKLEPEVLKYNQSVADNYHFGGVYPTLILAKTNSKVYFQFFYRNQDRDEYSRFILDQKAKMNE